MNMDRAVFEKTRSMRTCKRTHADLGGLASGDVSALPHVRPRGQDGELRVACVPGEPLRRSREAVLLK